MSLASGLGIIVVSVVLIVAVVRECRLFVGQGLPRATVLLHTSRILGFLLVGLGVLGQILAAAGYGGTGRPIEVDRWHPVLGNVGQGYEEGPTLLGECSTLAMITGLGVLLACTAVSWGTERRNR
jgi:hypothetical protein